MDKHYFIGIPMPSQIHSIATSKQEELQLRQFYKAIPYPEDLHITLLFIGGFPQEKLQPMQEVLKRISEHHDSFTLQITGVSSFGSNYTPRVIYLSVLNSDPLNSINRDIVEKACIFLDQSKKEKFVPHVTIAKKWKGIDGFNFQQQTFSPIGIEIDSFSLFEINPSRTPKYHPVETYELQQKGRPSQ
ncbi:RNA 2',3'-cyclic phosphodiesterase [Chungangia koreensis]|uniref:RNA 2',3'-cyclic phosphodiesterase n=1 Tax=Chungangia koreensis TaxID=752657 RepID=A0ABV8X1Q7_9LACT